MARKGVPAKAGPAAPAPGVDSLYHGIRSVLENARTTAYRAVNFAMVQAYWQVGRLIVQHEQGGERRLVEARRESSVTSEGGRTMMTTIPSYLPWAAFAAALLAPGANVSGIRVDGGRLGERVHGILIGKPDYGTSAVSRRMRAARYTASWLHEAHASAGAAAGCTAISRTTVVPCGPVARRTLSASVSISAKPAPRVCAVE